MTLLAPLATFGLPTSLLLIAGLLLAAGQVDWPALVLLAAVPLGLASGYCLVGIPWRGLGVVAGGYAGLGLAVGILFSLPTDFEDAGLLVGAAAGVIALGLAGYAAWGAWDVHRHARLDGPPPGGA